MNPQARCSASLAGLGSAITASGHVDAVGAQPPEQVVVQPPAEALLPRVEAEVDRHLARLVVRRPRPEDRRLGVAADLAVVGDHDQQVLARARIGADLGGPAVRPGRLVVERRDGRAGVVVVDRRDLGQVVPVAARICMRPTLREPFVCQLIRSRCS